jgi:predicted metal-dependent phosphoesterase TrpH
MPMYLDLHVHTTAFSSCSVLTPDIMAIAAKQAGLDGVCITEHNRIWSEQDAMALATKHGIAIFRGMEITTTGGDVLVFGVEEEPRQMWTAMETNDSDHEAWPDVPERPLYPLSPAALKSRVDQVGGVAIAAHPFRRFLVFGVGDLPRSVEEAMDNPTFSHVHGLEVCNSMATAQENEMAYRVAEAMGLIKLGGSDAHTAMAVGTCVTRFDDWINNDRELAQAILARRFTVERIK